VNSHYLALLRAVDDRNLLSHIYDEAIFAEILARIPEYAGLIGRIILVLERNQE
jgi:hypothetical protein